MKITNYFIILFFWITFGCTSFNGTKDTFKEISFTNQWDTVRVLKNPHKGWYHHLLDNGIDKYPVRDDSVFFSFPGMDHLYLRLCWSYLEPEEGKFDWHYIDEAVEKYVPRGYKISFRISCSETGRYPDAVGEELEGVQYATPSWVRKAGAKGTVVVTRGSGNKTWVPDWDDPIFIEKLDQFHKAFAARYDEQPWVSYVDIGSIGDWGEGHTSFTTQVHPTFNEVKINIDVYLKNYRKSLLVAGEEYFTVGKTMSEENELYKYAVDNGIAVRDDSPMVEYYIQNYLDTWSVSNPYLFDPLYLQKPVVFELQHYGSVKRNGNWLGKNGADTIPEYGFPGATIMREAIKTMHATYIGYHGYVEEWLTDNPDLTRELANLCGYWYFPVNASFPSVFSGNENELSISWINKGIAPAYDKFDLILRFEPQKPDNSFDVYISSGNITWLPETIKKEKYLVKIPPDSKKGTYALKFRLEERTREVNVPVLIGLNETAIDKDGFASLGIIHVK